MTMNPVRPVTRVQQTRRFFAPYQQLVILILGIAIGFVLAKL
jgi:hypothetical protein